MQTDIHWSQNKNLSTQIPIDLEPANQSSQSRVRYLRKLYFLTSLQMLVACWLTYEAQASESFRKWVYTWSGFTLYFCLIVVVGLQLIGLFARSMISSQPNSWVAYFSYTITFAFLMAYWESSRNDNLVAFGVRLITVVIIALFVHTLIAKHEITFQSTTIYILGSVFFMILIYEMKYTIPLFQTYLLGIFAILLGFYIVWDNETVLSGAKTEWNKEDYISGTVILYSKVVILLLTLTDLLRSLIVKARSYY